MCRPLRVWAKEDRELIQDTKAAVDAEVAQLTPFRQDGITVRHDLHLTMAEGKVVSVLAGEASYMKCPVCGAKPSEMNQRIQRPVNQAIARLGVSPLHLYIRCADLVLHVGERLAFQRWRIRELVFEWFILLFFNVLETDEDRAEVARRKQFFKVEFRNRLGELVGFALPSGRGNTNNGNMARTLFRNAEVFAEVLRSKFSKSPGLSVRMHRPG